jgi:hypothetical protein
MVIIAVLGVTLEGRWSQARPEWLLILALSPTAALVPAVWLTTLFRIRVMNGLIQHRLVNRFVLSERRADELQLIRIHSGGFGMVLEFSDGKKIRFLGAHLIELYRLANDLKSQCDHLVIVE